MAEALARDAFRRIRIAEWPAFTSDNQVNDLHRFSNMNDTLDIAKDSMQETIFSHLYWRLSSDIISVHISDEMPWDTVKCLLSNSSGILSECRLAYDHRIQLHKL
ncbi:unnamed protein product [Gongylonema pulchrum]|uniref:Neur_chan_LBD domain-containing protein n=1 Tax=Gongylonema pulchrum TaxID=637853 RepID=A0A183DJH2_9BILA|nr:unnamed protein product [Gongylonema pulchrum]